MSSEEIAQLNYLLTKMRNEVDMCLQDENIVPDVEKYYENLIKCINELLIANVYDNEVI